MFENCVQIRSYFSDYLDDVCEPDVRRSLRFHLAYCESCRNELDGWQTLRSELRSMPRRHVPPNLGLRLRVQLSQRLHRHLLRRLWVRWDNALQSFLLPACGGVLAAVICFFLIMGSEVVPVTNIPDVPLRLVTPPRPSRDVTLSPWRELEGLGPIDFNTGDKPVVVVTQIDAEGRATGYRVLSGQSSPELIHRLDRMIYFSVFQPATMFGIPTDGQVVLSLRRITVRG
jgi:putative zinc finger protein